MPQPGVLKLLGTTDFSPERVLQVHAPFDGRVDRVFVDLGSDVKKGDPLLEFFSTELADAKSEYEIASSQYEYDKKVYDDRKAGHLRFAEELEPGNIEVKNNDARAISNSSSPKTSSWSTACRTRKLRTSSPRTEFRRLK